MKASFKSLKKTSDESSAFVTQARSSMVELNEERKCVAECFKSACLPIYPQAHFFKSTIKLRALFSFVAEIEPFLSEDGEYVKGSETKLLVGELQVECEKCMLYLLISFVALCNY